MFPLRPNIPREARDGEAGESGETSEKDMGAEQEEMDVTEVLDDAEEAAGKSESINPKNYVDVPKCSATDNARVPKSLKSPIRPPQAEVDKHELTHLPYRHWCRVCVESKGKEDPHPRGRQDEDDRSGLPIVSFDYQEMNEELQLRLLVGKDEATGMVLAH